MKHQKKAQGSSNTADSTMQVIDYGRSFIQSSAPGNAVRFWVESRTRIIDQKSGAAEDFCQCGSCKSEDAFAEKKKIFYDPNYDFLPVFGSNYGVIFRRHASVRDNYRDIIVADEFKGGGVYHLKEAMPVRELKTAAEIRAATHQALPLVARTEMVNEQTGLRAIIECPVKTMNINDERDIYGVDTGPVAFPDISKRYERMVDSISLAFVAFNAFNAPNFANFAIEAPTVVGEDGPNACRVFHYSDIRVLPAVNRMYCIGELETC